MRKIHLVTWDKVDIPKRLGGLALCKLEVSNMALLTKWAWRYKSDKNGFWKKVIECIHRFRDDSKVVP